MSTQAKINDPSEVNVVMTNLHAKGLYVTVHWKEAPYGYAQFTIPGKHLIMGEKQHAKIIAKIIEEAPKHRRVFAEYGAIPKDSGRGRGKVAAVQSKAKQVGKGKADKPSSACVPSKVRTIQGKNPKNKWQSLLRKKR